MDQLPRGFREGLRRELPRWRDEGLVAPEAAAALAVRYRLAERDADAPTLLPVYLLGALLVGAGVVSLVAWHWEGMSAAAQLALIGGLMVACHAGGWTLSKGTGRAPQLGHALTLLGTLVFGANVALVAQIFHASLAWWAGAGAFAAGALAAGLLYESLPHHLLAAALALFLFGPGLAETHPLGAVAVSYLLGAVFAVLAWRTRSRSLAVVTALGLGASLASAATASGHEEGAMIIVAALAALAASAPLAAAPFTSRSDTALRLAAPVRVVGRAAFCAVAFLLSFGDLAHTLRFHGAPPRIAVAAALPALLLAAAALAAGLRRAEVDPLARGEAMLLAATVLALAAGLSLEHGTGTALVANLVLLFLAAGRIVRGLSTLARVAFWEGIAVAGLTVVSRFLELDTALWLKGTGFIACGVAVLGAGFLFERRRARTAEVAHVA